jgi:hypothetical protein
MRKLLILWFALNSTHALADVAKLPEFYFWKSSFVEIQAPTVVGAWKSKGTAYLFRADGTGAILHGENATYTIKWRQRRDGKIYIDRAQIGPKPKKMSGLSYVGYIKRGVFIRDELDYRDKYRKVRSKRGRSSAPRKEAPSADIASTSGSIPRRQENCMKETCIHPRRAQGSSQRRRPRRSCVTLKTFSKSTRSIMSVSIAAGATAFTRMPFLGVFQCGALCVRPSTACLEAVQTDAPAIPIWPAMLPLWAFVRLRGTRPLAL